MSITSDNFFVDCYNISAIRQNEPFAPSLDDDGETKRTLETTRILRDLDETSNAERVAAEIRNQIRQRNTQLRQSMDGLQNMSESIDRKAELCASRVKAVTRSLVAILEARERELLLRIDQARVQKIKLIEYQMDDVCQHFAKLADALDLVSYPDKYVDKFELMRANREAFETLKEAINLGCVVPCENDNFVFLPSRESSTLFRDLALIGNLQITSSTLMDSKRPQSRSLAVLNVSLDSLSLGAAKARSIYGIPSAVELKRYGPIPVKVWGKRGAGKGEISRPWGITTNRLGQILIADRSNHRVQVLDAKYSYLFEFGSHGSGKGQFDKPSSVAVNPTDDIVVVDKDNHRIQVFDQRGRFLFSFGDKGSRIGQFLYPWDVAIDGAGSIYVSDTRNHRIQMFKWNGIFVAQWGGELSETGAPKLFDSPRGITLDPQGNILVTDFNLHKVFVIDSQTNRIRIIGRQGTVKGTFDRPQGICCDDRGWFVVADSRNYRFQVFDEKGNFMWMAGRKGKLEPGEFDRPGDLFIDPEGHIHLMDLDNERVQVF